MVPSLGQEDPLEEGTGTHSTILAWRIPRTEAPGGLQSTGPDTTEATCHTRTHTRFRKEVGSDQGKAGSSSQ